MATTAAGTRRGPRGPVVMYAGLTAMAVVLIATLALTTRQPPPPAIAEFAPQARHQIRQAPMQQTSSVGNAPGAATAATTTTTSTTVPGPPAVVATPPTIDLPAVHHCVGNPPRQIPDTQSPPCVAYWVGNNGGATAPGVTGNEIKVLVNPASIGDGNANRVVADLQTFFNRYFEFYGRQLRLINGSTESGNCPGLEAAADGLVAKYKPFADAGNDNSRTCAQLEFAHDHVIALGYQDVFSQADLASGAPYLWEYPRAPDQQFADIGSFVCAQLAGRPARYSPDGNLAAKTRRFGLIYEYDQTPDPVSTSALTDKLAACGVTLTTTATYVDQTLSNGVEEEQSVINFSSNAVLSMKGAGVSTVICACLNVDTIETELPTEADLQHYRPEWLLTSSENDSNVVVKTLWPTPDQREGLMGMTWQPAQVPYPDATLNWALAAVDPGFQIQNSSTVFANYQRFYWEMLMVASGIQTAGPDLTARTFESGLDGAQFPNPSSPEQEGAVGFGGGDHSMTTDAAVMWWSNSASSPYPDDGAGAWCYVDGGQRFSGDWSRPMNLFTGACNSSPPGS